MVSKEHAQQILMQAQSYQQQMQSILAQKEALKIQQIEISKTLEELGKTGEGHVYKSSGAILIKTTKDSVKKELGDRSEFISTRLQTLERSEKKVRERIEELRERLSKEEDSSGGG